MSKLPVFYNCGNCPAYCCSYARIEVTQGDVRRLARHFGIGAAAARRRFTKKGHEENERVLKHQRDPIFGTICRFLDLETRQCTVYESRPELCRDFPGLVRCGYYDFLSAERKMLEDAEYVSTTWNWEGSGAMRPFAD